MRGGGDATQQRDDGDNAYPGPSERKSITYVALLGGAEVAGGSP